MKLQHRVDLKKLNTLQLSAQAETFVEIDSVEDLTELATQDLAETVSLVLGEGSNLLLSKNVSGLVIKNNIHGINLVKENNDFVWLGVGGGHNWHELVEHCVQQNWGGVENLAFIPGTAGAAPVQNIAAYGQNFSDVVDRVEYFDWLVKEFNTLTPQECNFGYRDSIFKRQLRGRAVITQVYIKLTKNPHLETSYYSIGGRNDSLLAELAETATKPYSVADVFQAVVRIRRRKLPDWKTTPTVGSYFINPIVNHDKLIELQKTIPGLQSYPAEQLIYRQLDESAANLVKIPVGRLLDYLGWRGKQVGNCQVTQENAAIFTHNGQASGSEFLDFTQKIRRDVLENFGIELDTEVVII